MKRRIQIINQFIPPDVSPTSVLVGDLAEALRAKGCEVHCIGRPDGYRHRTRGVRRYLSEGWEWVRLVWTGCRTPACSDVVVFSSPPLVLIAGNIVATWHRAKLHHWILDAYPDLALALGALPEGWWTRVMRAAMKEAYRACRSRVTVSRAMQQWMQITYGLESSVVRPWPPKQETECLTLPVYPREKVWLYSGNLGRAHEWRALLDVQEILEKRGSVWRLHLQGGGQGWEAARQEAARRGLRQIQLSGYAPKARLLASLASAHVRVATCKTEVRGMLWPSKCAVLACLPGPHLWIGPPLEEADRIPDLFCFHPEETTGIADWLEALDRLPECPHPATVKESVDRARSTGLSRWKGQVLGS